MLHKWIFIGLVNLVGKTSIAEDCTLKISGRILDRHDKSILDYATVFIQELDKGNAADSNGYFELTDICPGTYHFIVEHIGCTPDTLKLLLTKSINRDFYLEHHTEELEEVIATAKKEDKESSQTISEINKKSLTYLEGKDLGNILSTISGVNQLKTGSNINKPIIHGLYGDRIAIISSGVKLETQDWGSEHAPEVDPFASATIKVIKGVGNLEYGSDAMGGMVIMEPPVLQKSKHFNVGISLIEQSNGRGTTTSAKIEQGFKKPIAYFIQGTYKRIGDQQTPKYNLTNTGIQEGNLSTGIGIMLKGWDISAYYALYHQELAILRSAHIGNLTDLQNAISSDRPLIVNPFSYNLDNPKQQVEHHLGKLHISKYLKNQQQLHLTYSIQVNNRKEYDIRRGGRSNIPALDMQLSSNTLLGTYEHLKPFVKKNSTLETKVGFNFLSKHNANNPQTGIRPLIPDYHQYQLGIFAMEKLSVKEFLIEAGIRYDYTHFQVYRFDRQNNLLQPKYNFHTYAGSFGFNWAAKENIIQTQSNISISARFPNASELFSEGLHHGIAALEFGNANLKPESGVKWINTITLKHQAYIEAEATFYVSKIYNFIYLAPLPEPILTIRGAFPAFQYYQTNARLIGLDLTLKSNPVQFLSLLLKSSILRGRNTTVNDNLIYMPSNRISAAADIHHDFKRIKKLFLNVQLDHIFRQNHTPTGITDYKEVPKAYTTLNTTIGFEYAITPKHQFTFSICGENITNSSYRDYLDRFRYYADALGWNLTARIKYTFNN